MNTTAVASAASTPVKQGEPVKLLKRIGSTTYTVSVHFSKENKEPLEDKLFRMIESEVKKRA